MSLYDYSVFNVQIYETVYIILFFGKLYLSKWNLLTIKFLESDAYEKRQKILNEMQTIKDREREMKETHNKAMTYDFLWYYYT